MGLLVDAALPPASAEARRANLPNTLAFIDGRRAGIMSELAAGSPDWPNPLRAPICFPHAGAFDASFATTFGTWPTGDTMLTGDGSVGGTVNDVPFAHAVDGLGAPAVGAAVGVDPNVPDGTSTVLVQVASLSDGRIYYWVVTFRTYLFAAGTHELDDVDVQAVLLEYFPSDGSSANRGRAYGGTVTVTQGDTAVGSVVSGTLHADLIQIGF
jgi:hypothetical protein